MNYHIMIHNMTQMNKAVATLCDEALASEDPDQIEGAMKLCDIFGQTAAHTQTNMRMLHSTLRGFDEPLPEGEVDDFEASVLASIAALP